MTNENATITDQHMAPRGRDNRRQINQDTNIQASIIIQEDICSDMHIFLA